VHSLRRYEENVAASMRAVSLRSLLSALIEAQANRCSICSGPMAPLRTMNDPGNRKRPTQDHVVPKGLRGYDGKGNILAAHWDCNGRKGNNYPSEAELLLLERVNRLMGWPDRQERAA
jgi:hypothetical protein